MEQVTLSTGKEVNSVKVKQRDSYFDNAKFLLMVLVVFGHLIQPFIEDKEFFRDIYYTMFTFHMPAFILISGFFSKNYQRPGYLFRSFKMFIVTYFVFQIIYSIFYWVIGGFGSFGIDFSIPHWSLWFLVSMFFWNVSLVFFGKLKPHVGIPLSILLALGAGYLPFIDRELTMQRTLVFLPFFIIGFYLSPQFFKKLQTDQIRGLGAIGLSLSFVFIHLNESLNKYWLFGSKPYEDFLSIPELGAIVRGIVFILGIIGIFSFMSFVPTKKTFFTDWGRNTFNVYLLHGFIVKGSREIFDSFELNWLGFLLIIAISFGVTVLLGSNQVAGLLQKLASLPKTFIARIK